MCYFGYELFLEMQSHVSELLGGCDQSDHLYNIYCITAFFFLILFSAGFQMAFNASFM